MAANEPGQPPLIDAAARTANLPVPRCALAIGAHPDDVEFGCGATLAKWAAQGCIVHRVVCTDGSKGTWDPDADTGALATTRQAEQHEAARRLGGAGVIEFLGHVDGELASGAPERAEVARWIRRLRPDVVLGHDPWKRYRLHPDHRHAGLLACEGIVAARDPHFFREQGLAPHRPSELLLWEADEPDHAEDASGHLAAKLHSLDAHASQFVSTMGATDAKALDEFRERMRQRMEDLGRAHGMAMAEVFKRISDL